MRAFFSIGSYKLNNNYVKIDKVIKMSEKLRVLETERLELYQEYKKKNSKGTIILVVGIVLFIVGILTELFIMSFIGMVFGVVIGVIFLGSASKIANEYSKKVKSKLVMLLLEDLYQDVEYDMNSYIQTNIVTESGLVARPDRVKGNDLISAKYKGVKFTVSDLHYERRETRVDSKGNTHTTYVTFFKGRFYIFEFNRVFDHQLKIIERGLFGISPSARGFKKYETESIAFNKKFNLTATDQQFVFYIVTPLMLEKFQELEQMHRGHIGFSLNRNQLMIAVNDSYDYLEVKIKTPINENTIKGMRADTDIMASIINEFRLDSNKFNLK